MPIIVVPETEQDGNVCMSNIVQFLKEGKLGLGFVS